LGGLISVQFESVGDCGREIFRAGNWASQCL
jgi:hypothetical protein